MEFVVQNDDKTTYDKFTGDNYAYRQRNGVQDADWEFKDILDQYRNNDDLTIEEAWAVIYIDLQSAFDTIEWDFIFEMLRKMNMPNELT